jgi:membrane protein YqaA with SNARE-associated domain
VTEPKRPKPTDARSRWIAFSWGLAEATFFFIVPDVFLTRLALREFWNAVTASLFAVAGALSGGAALWIAGRHGHAGALLHLFERLPGINADLVERSARALNEHGLTAFLTGALQGIPYKLFAVQSGALDVPFISFLAFSAGARFLRFFAGIALAWLAGRALRKRSDVFRNCVHALFWLLFYGIYFAAMG